MERAVAQTGVESMRHPPALYWGVVSAAALCSVWGTFTLAKRSMNERNQRNGKLNPGVAFKRLRRKYAEKLRPLLEDLVYLTMFIIDILVGVFYWVLDFFFDGRVSSENQNINASDILSNCVDSDDLRTVDVAEAMYECKVLHRPPRRGEIKRLGTRWAWGRCGSKPNPRQGCECWGWRVKDLALGSNGSEDHRTESPSVGSRNEIPSENEGNVAGKAGRSRQTRSQDGEEEVTIRPRWSECHCSQCSPLLMPMRVAAERLHVLGEESFRGKQGELLSISCSTPFDASNLPADECSSEDVSPEKERTGVIFIHGMFSSATFWFDTDIASNLSDAIKKQHQIFAPDLLGCGRSPRPVDSLYTLTDQIEAIERSVIQRYKLESFHLVGHSMGSIIALALAARCPQRVRSITLIAPVYPPSCLDADGQLIQLPCNAFFSFLDPLTLKGVRALTVCKYYNISRLLGHLFYSKHTYWEGRFHDLIGKRKGYPRSFIRDYITNYHDAAWHIAHNSLLAGTHAVIPALLKLRKSGHHILVIHGEIDTSIHFRLAQEMSRTFSNVELVGVPEKGHVDVVWGRAKENALLIDKAIRDGDNWWSNLGSLDS